MVPSIFIYHSTATLTYYHHAWSLMHKATPIPFHFQPPYPPYHLSCSWYPLSAAHFVSCPTPLQQHSSSYRRDPAHQTACLDELATPKLGALVSRMVPVSLMVVLIPIKKKRAQLCSFWCLWFRLLRLLSLPWTPRREQNEWYTKWEGWRFKLVKMARLLKISKLGPELVFRWYLCIPLPWRHPFHSLKIRV